MKVMKHFCYKLLFLTLFLLTFLPTVPVSAAEVELPSLPGAPSPYEGPAQFVKYVYIFALGLAGILAFGMIAFAGLEWTLSGGNESWKADAKDRIQNAIFGLLLLLAAYVIFNTINPDLVLLRQPSLGGINVPPPTIPTQPGQPGGPGQPTQPTDCSKWIEYGCITQKCSVLGPDWEDANINCPTPGAGRECTSQQPGYYCGRRNPRSPGGPGQPNPTPGPPPGPTSCDDITSSMCENPHQIAAACNARFPAGNHPRTEQVLNCVKDYLEKPESEGGFGEKFGGSIFTYEQSNQLCNYTKGRTVCGGCQHAENSCHYGGSPNNPEGNQGALAIDWGFAWLNQRARNDEELRKLKQKLGKALENAAKACGGVKSVRCESGSKTVGCESADHVHMSIVGCDRN